MILLLLRGIVVPKSNSERKLLFGLTISLLFPDGLRYFLWNRSRRANTDDNYSIIEYYRAVFNEIPQFTPKILSMV